VIRELYLHNFKCFATERLELGALTLLSGLNGMGKSSVMQAFLLLRQSQQQGLLHDTGLALNGDLVRLGTAQDVFFEHATEDYERIAIGLTLEDGTRQDWPFDYSPADDVVRLAAQGHSDPAAAIYRTALFSDDFHYLQAERLGPRTSFGTSDYLVRQHRQIGPSGEYAPAFLSFFGARDIPNPLLRHPRAAANDLKNQVEAWMGEVSPGTRLNLTARPDMDLMGLRFSFVTGGEESRPYRATNVGFGLTYTLPIVVATLAAEPGSLLLIENPEAHLHPRGQALMGELLALAAAGGVQVVIETHSDHVLNGIRLAVHGGRIAPEMVRLHYFERRDLGGQVQHVVTSPRIDRDGRIDDWPEGFFDEWDKSLEVLLQPRED
jgi:predicted ATPase